MKQALKSSRLMILTALVFAQGFTVAGVSAMQAASGGTTRYVDFRTGDDSHDGLSPASAWKSLDKVNRQTFKAGDRILFRAGSVWKGQLKPQGSGTAEHPICIDQYGNTNAAVSYRGLPRIDGEGRFETTLLLYNVEGWEVRNLELTNTGESNRPHRTGATVKIRDFGTARHIVLEGLYIHDVNGSYIKDKGAGQGIFLSNGGTETLSRFDGLLVQNCFIQRTHRNGIIQEGYWERDNWYPNLNVVFRGNLLDGVPGDGIVPIGCDGALIEYNRMRNCPPTLPDGQWAAGIWPWSCDNTLIQYNEVSDHKAPGDAQGFDSDYNCRNTVIQYNFSHDNEGGFLLVCNAAHMKMPHNIGNSGTIVRYNLSINDGIRTNKTRWGYYAPTFHINGLVVDTQIYNNTIIVPGKAHPEMDRRILHLDDGNGTGKPVNTFFFNNIFIVEDEAEYDLGNGVCTVFLNNLYHGTHNSRPEDAKAITADPKFAEPVWAVGERGAVSSDGFVNDELFRKLRLQVNSPCIGAGMRISGNGGQDLVGKPVSDNRCSVGAIE